MTDRIRSELGEKNLFPHHEIVPAHWNVRLNYFDQCQISDQKFRFVRYGWENKTPDRHTYLFPLYRMFTSSLQQLPGASMRSQAAAAQDHWSSIIFTSRFLPILSKRPNQIVYGCPWTITVKNHFLKLESGNLTREALIYLDIFQNEKKHNRRCRVRLHPPPSQLSPLPPSFFRCRWISPMHRRPPSILDLFIFHAYCSH